jgi:phenylpropionate dioxygenase-like ring-hydroxylating dioxygenase large terminal subunit
MGMIDTIKLPEPKLSDKPITGDRYYSREFMQAEWDHMWTRVWQVAGVEAQLAKPGDFITAEIGPESILCTRDTDGKIRAFYNVCQHRGNRLVDDEQGHAPRIVCRYHGWQFKSDGELVLVPCPEDFPQGNPCGKLNLVELPCEVWSGLVWFTMDEGAGSLADYLGPVKGEIETYAMERMFRTHWVTIEGDFNWKCVQDNFSESYHVPFVHPQTKYIMEQSYRHCQFDLYDGHGHTRMLMPGSRPTLSLKGEVDTTMEMMKEELEFWELDPNQFRDKPHDMRLALQKQKRALGAAKGYEFSRFNDDQLTDHYHYTIFPNISFSLKPDGCIWLRGNPHPTDPQKCLFDMWYFTWFPEGENRYYSHSMCDWVDVSKPAPHMQGKFGEVTMGPGIDQDVAIWSSQQKGLTSRGYRGDYMPDQERRVRFFHDHLDKYLAGEI